MVKKERKISIPNFDKSAFVQPVGALPTSVEITKTVATVTGKAEIIAPTLPARGSAMTILDRYVELHPASQRLSERAGRVSS